jgi:ATP-dependent protease ClpP protease subunit
MSKYPFRVVKNEVNQVATVYLYGIIGEFWETDNPITARGLQQILTSLSNYPIVHLRLNGPGGDTHEGFAMGNIIKAFSRKQQIHAWNDGLCASFFAVLLLAVKREYRHAAKNSLVMVHSSSCGNWGNKASMIDTAEMLDKHDEILAEFLSDATGGTVEEVRVKWMDGKDHWLTATEAEAENLLTVEDYEAVDMPENVTTMKVETVAAFYNSQSKITNTDMDIFSTKFKTISALAKVAVADRTADQFKAVNDELQAEGITGATLVPDATLTLTIEQADKVPGLDIQVTNLTAEKTTLTAKITALEATVAAQLVELGKPAEEVKQPVTDKTDSTGNPVVVLDFNTSVDDEYKRIWGK